MEERPDQHTDQTSKHLQCVGNAQLQLHREVSHQQNQEDHSGYPLQECLADQMFFQGATFNHQTMKEGKGGSHG